MLEAIHDDKTYAAELTPTKREKVQVRAGTFEAVAVQVRLRVSVSLEEERAKEEDKFRSICIWMSDDEKRIPVKMEADMLIGAVYAELVSSHP